MLGLDLVSLSSSVELLTEGCDAEYRVLIGRGIEWKSMSRSLTCPLGLPRTRDHTRSTSDRRFNRYEVYLVSR